MSENFLHGVEVVEINTGSTPISTVRSSIIGIVGTAPRADATAFPLNTPVLIANSRKLAAKLDMGGATGTPGTLPGALDDIFDQAGAVVIVVRVEEGTTPAQTMANVIGGVDAQTGNYLGCMALVGAESVVGFPPRILIAPGFTHQRPEDPEQPGVFLINPVVAELKTVAERLRAVIIQDGANTNDADALAQAGDFDSRRIYLVDPWVKKAGGEDLIVTRPPSACAAGLLAKVDNDMGFWWSPSNQPLNGVLGTARPVDFALGDPNCRANLLNEGNVATIIRQDGFRLWGNRTLSSDNKWAFLSVVRTADILNDGLLRAHLWAVDRNITRTYVEDVVESVNNYIRKLVGLGALLGGRCYSDPDLNSPSEVQQGRVYFNIDFTPPYPAERITFQSRMVNDYLKEIF